MSARSRAAYFAAIERPISRCEVCSKRGARYAKDQKRLCKECRAKVRNEQRAADRIDGYDRDDLGESPDY